MDKHWEENSKLSKTQKSSKTKVMRLNDKETKLINFIRHTNPELLLSELRNAFSNSVNKANYLNLKRIISILEDRKVFELKILVDMEFISKEEAEYLVKCMKENKNIIITGGFSVGKTTLLNSLLEYQEQHVMMIFERVKQLILDKEILNKNIITYKESESISLKDLSVLDTVNSRLVIEEIQNCDDGLGLLYALNIGSSVLGTIYSKGNWREDFLNLFNDNMKKYAEETLNQNKFIQVNISINSDGNRIVNKIEEM